MSKEDLKPIDPENITADEIKKNKAAEKKEQKNVVKQRKEKIPKNFSKKDDQSLQDKESKMRQKLRSDARKAEVLSEHIKSIETKPAQELTLEEKNTLKAFIKKYYPDQVKEIIKKHGEKKFWDELDIEVGQQRVQEILLMSKMKAYDQKNFNRIIKLVGPEGFFTHKEAKSWKKQIQESEAKSEQAKAKKLGILRSFFSRLRQPITYSWENTELERTMIRNKNNLDQAKDGLEAAKKKFNKTKKQVYKAQKKAA